MNIKTLLVFFFLTVYNAFGQMQHPRIKVVLLGTFHFGATSDRNSTAFPDLFSEKRQSELDDIANKLDKFGVNKFFLETPVKRQSRQDSLFIAYKNKTLKDTLALRDEQVQIAFRTALLNNAKLIASDNRQELPYNTIVAYETEHKNDSVSSYPFFDVQYPFTVKQKKLKEVTLSQYYIQLNNRYNSQALMFDYIHYALSYGKEADYVGEAFTLSWYDRNLKIFTNILRNIDVKSDKVIVVLYGSAHTALIRHFFEDHPYFEIVELDKILN